MADLIAKIIHRIGADDELPQLEAGEFGFSTDRRKLYIGNDPTLYPIDANNITTQTEVLTRYSDIDISQITGFESTPVIITNPISDGQVIVYDLNSGSIVNRGGMKPGKVDLGSVNNIKISGGYYNYTLETDGLGNLSWNSKGTITANIVAISASSPAVMTLSNTTPITNRAIVTIAGVQGLNSSIVNGKHFHVKVSENFTTTGNVELYQDTDLTIPLSTVSLSATANTGRSVHTSYNKVVTGSDQFVQFNDKGIMGSDPTFKFNKTTNTLTAELITGTITVDAASQPNITTIGTLTSLSVSGNANIGNNLSVIGNISAGANVNVGSVLNSPNVVANIVNANIVNATDVVILGNLVVQGNTVHTNVEELTIEDPIISIGGGANGVSLTVADVHDRGLVLNRYDADVSASVKSFIGWDKSANTFLIASNVQVTSEVVTVNTLGSVKLGSLVVDQDLVVNQSSTFNGNVSILESLNVGGSVLVEDDLAANSVIANVFVSTEPVGSAPFVVNSNTVVANLRAETANVSDFTNDILGGAARQIVVQSSANSTAFLDAPTVANTALVWNGSQFTWEVTDSGNVLGGDTNQILFQTGPNTTGFITAPAVTNTALKWDGTNFVWGVGGATIVNDTTSTTDKYPLFAYATSGSAETVYTSDANYLYKPGTGELKAPALIATNGIILNSDTLTANYTIQTGTNGMSVGPFSISPGTALTLSAGQRHVII